ncbi:MAG: ATP-dependent DNA helicase RecG [Peptococcaceae bacterium]|nr:ATP-dependent DNA helicase RecG [Peptococcaceae bacterium]
MHLNDSITVLKGVGKQRAADLQKLGIVTVGDLLGHYPYRYEDRSQLKPLRDMKEGDTETVTGIIVQAQDIYPRRGLKILRVSIRCADGNAVLVWFNQNHLKNKLQPGLQIVATGKVGKGSLRQISVTDFELIEDEDDLADFQRIVPVYRGTERNSGKQIRKLVVQTMAQEIEGLEEFLPDEHLQKYHLMDYGDAVQQIHFPEEWQQLNRARHRLVFNEFLELTLGLQLHSLIEKKTGIAHVQEESLAAQFFKGLPFGLTNAQKKVILEVKKDMERPVAMKRLVQGDVGSGKTMIAVYALLKAVTGGYQAVMMAPTEILAEQHYLNLKRMLEPLGIEPVLLTGSLTRKERETIYEKISDGTCRIAVGTHALIQKQVQFANLGVVVIDEQHRFGVRQRLALENKGMAPDVLVMTATPIPRSLALTLYGDMDLSIIDELPPGRQSVKTYCMGENKRRDLYRFLGEQIASGYQVYVVCPLVEESEKMDLENATQLADHLAANVFPQYAVGLLHGKMRPQEKAEIMEQFRDNQLQILVSTTVIEVGVDVPNANVMVIENAERFGLAQLHQLRGRVGRGTTQAHCFLISEPKTDEGKRRMQVMVKSTDGFVIAEEDLLLRGAGEVLGTRQHGLPDLKIADLVHDVKILEQSRMLADEITEIGLEQPQYELLRKKAEAIYQRKMDLGE